MTDADFKFFASFLKDRSGIALEASKQYLIDTRMAPILKEKKLADLAALVTALKAGDKTLGEMVVEAMTTNETSFFRDVTPFDAFRNEILPRVIERRDRERKLQIWSAASSSGQEPYSIAILLREHFPQLASWNVNILATDLSKEMVEKTSKGEYSQLEVNRGLPAPLLAKYFSRKGVRWHVNDDVRKLLTSRTLNLLENWVGIPPADVVFIRNVLIYFEPELKKQILGKIRKILRPGGYLFLGGAESTLNLDSHYKRLDIARSGCFQLEEA
ncbi:protein-glutamate O-methyltransferase CheR [Myxococcota bacterium]|nr:protein-glutamate O-methyltransferase CheR [Myxococcota bacterium]